MSNHFVLSPYRLPGQHTVSLGNADASALLNAYLALWHPDALGLANKPPQFASPYDHEQPQAGHLYALSESPPVILPDDWQKHVADGGAAAFTATSDREETLARMHEAIEMLKAKGCNSTLGVTPGTDQVADFAGIGFGLAMVDALYEAMQHEKLLDIEAFWKEIQEALTALADADPKAYRKPLQAAADRLLAAREVLYPVTIHLLDIYLACDDKAELLNPIACQKANILASAEFLETQAARDPSLGPGLKKRIAEGELEFLGGVYREREDALLPVESQLWNFLKGQETYQKHLDTEVKVYGRKVFAAHTHLPMFLHFVGMPYALLLAFDDGVLPSHRATVVSWPSPDGKQVEAFARKPEDSDSPQTYLHLAYHLHQTIMQDHAATLALLHRRGTPSPFYNDWLALSSFGPVLGKWSTFSNYFNEVLAGEYASAAPADDFHADSLTDRTTNKIPRPVSAFALQVRGRRRIDACLTLAAMFQGLTKSDSTAMDNLINRLKAAEEAFELSTSLGGDHAEAWENKEGMPAAFTNLESEVTRLLSERLLARSSTASGPGYLALNPCSFARRVALEIPEISTPLKVEGPIRASQVDSGTGRLVVEIPPLGFAWFPQSNPAPSPGPFRQPKLANENTVRNEFFEAEIDPKTGGLRGIRDLRTRVNRVAQQLVYQPGSQMICKEVRVVSEGPALGEILAVGELRDEFDKPLAAFEQRLRAWLGRPLLEMRITLKPLQAPTGYPWHAYYGARFAWRDERATLVRGVNGQATASRHTRPLSPEFIEIRSGKFSTALFPGGLPFHQRHGSRMFDMILIAEGESETNFELAIGLDREQPMQTALGLVTPTPLFKTAGGPPLVGCSGWLYHLDAGNALLFNLKPVAGADAIIASFLECAGSSFQAEFRCVRNPVRAHLQNARGQNQRECSIQNDAVAFELLPGDLNNLRVDFSE